MSDPDEVFDVLVVGGGPGGTAAAFRAHELGLRPLVIDFDDLMKRIRDYSKDKLILPTFGGGDRMRFPKGGEILDCLCFGPIDKDDMCRQWKELYRRHDVPYRVGLELVGLERKGGAWEARAWDHAERCDAAFRARCVVLAIGRGVPRRFDLPGSTEGIAFRLTDPGLYVGRPACVIGGGTSAAEAVIAISGAKAAAGDPTAVYWSYRGDRMPRVSKALAEVFFEAYVGHGNIRYYPLSEPAAVVTGEDREEYLAIRVDRRRMAGRPAETTHLEFPKASCVACIGEDIPETLLAGIGVPIVVGGPKARKRMAVTPHLETVQPGVFLVGDILSQAYFETDDFDADPAGFREVQHRGNIKSAMRDGVLVAEVIRQKLDGVSEIDVRLEDAEEPERSPVVPVGAVAADGPPAASLAPERRVAPGVASLVRVLPSGVEDDEYPIGEHAAVTIGREGCDLVFPDDTAMSPRHASVVHDDDGYLLRDDGSAGGVFLRVPSTEKIEARPGDVIAAGRQFLLFSETSGRFAVTHYDTAGRERGRHELPPERTIILGRQAPDVTLDPDDKTLSRRQLALTADGGRILVKDLKSVNGTYLRVRGSRRIEHGQAFRAGQQRFVLSVHGGAVLDAGHEPSVRPSPATPSPPPAGAPTVTFHGLGKTCPVAPGQTICEAAEAHGIPINAECRSGICGSDPIRVLSGRENLEAPATDQEADTLADLCDLEAGEHRLACMARVKGPVIVGIV